MASQVPRASEPTRRSNETSLPAAIPVFVLREML